ncbi:MAG: RNA polymerase sigma factor [Armatimonadetes bacterium]|nr:RNA polymerase sigma factor [Armatimonadota bacterium]
MQSPESDCPEKRLDRMWSEHRTYLKHLLLGLTRDIHLTDDLLQETYVHARAGIVGYAGGSSCAWLAEIAKRCFFAHRRRRYVRMEEPLEPEEEEAGEDRVGSLDHLMLLELRRAISELDLPVRTALIMKHYGGFTYKDIAEHQCCPVGTAKWRVSSALDRLREALAAPRKERIQMECGELGGTVLADYVYRILPARKATTRARSSTR